MTYKKYSLFLLGRVLILVLLLLCTAYLWNEDQNYFAAGTAVLSLVWFLNIHSFLSRRFTEIDDFFEAVKYRDFSRRFREDSGPQDLRRLHKGFNEVNRVVREINTKKEIQYLYLQKILEMVDVGIIAFNVNSGEVLWANDSVRDILNFPSFKKVSFVARRKPEIYKEVFSNSHPEPETLTLEINKERIKVLISDSIFKIEDAVYKLVVLQNIDETLNQNESEAWKKLLSVMTHEIMNSIAPISSLAESLHQQVKQAIEDPDSPKLDMEDMDMGIASIRNRSEGLMKFAKTYRSLNKVTQLNLELVKVDEFFAGIENLMLPSIREKQVDIEFVKKHPDLVINIDTYLIEQVIINIILNAVDASLQKEHPRILITAEKSSSENIAIKIADNGTGIPAEILDTVFVPFFTTKKTGSGIGLSLSKQIMLLHKGKINIHSVEGKGTEVSLIFG